MSFRAFINKNGSTIATAGTIILTIGAVFFAVKKSKSGAEAREAFEEKMDAADGNAQLETEARIEYIKDIAVAYKETLICAGTAIILAYTSHKSDAKKIANLGASLALNEEKVKKLYNYIERKLEPQGLKKKDIEKELVEKDPDAQFTPTEKVHKRYRKEEPVVFKDSYLGTQFESTLKDFYAASDRAELILNRRGAFGLGFNKWMNLLGLGDTPAGASVGWKPSEFKVYLQESIIDGQPVMIICYKDNPNSNYWR